MTIREYVKSLLDDEPLVAEALPGGIHVAGKISRQETPAAFDEQNELRPCALIKLSTAAGDGPARIASRQYLRLFFYQKGGTAAIDQAAGAARLRLHRDRGQVGDWEIAWLDEMRDQEDPALDNARLHFCRYQVMQRVFSG